MNLSTDPLPNDGPKGKFLFDLSFDSESTQPTRPGGEPKLVLTESELEAKKLDSFTQGIATGKNEAAASQQTQMNAMLATVSHDLAMLADKTATQNHLRDEAMANAIKAITRKLLPQYVAQHGYGEIEALVTKTLNDLREEPRLVIRVADMHTDVCAQRLPELAKQIAFPGQLIILGESTLGPSDVRIEWADGGLERLENNLWAEIERVLAKYTPGSLGGAGPARAAQVQEYTQPAAAEMIPSEGGIDVNE